MGSSNHPNSPANLPSTFPSKLAAVLLCIVALVYCLQVASPLRINTDAYRLLSMAVSASEGQGYLVDGQPDQFPNGYPFLVRYMLTAGIANSASLVALNLLFYAAGLCVLWLIATSLSRRSLALIVVLWVASSWLVIKHATIPLSDAGYFGLSLAALYCLWKFFNAPLRTAWPWFLAALALIFLSLQFRTVGITLLPTAVVSIILHHSLYPLWRSCGNHKAKIAWSLATVAVAGSAILVWVAQTEWFVSQFLAEGSYFQSMVGYFDRQGMLGFFGRNLGFRLREMGEIALNFPENKLTFLSPAFYLAGLAAWGFVGLGCICLVKRGFLPLVVYVVFYLGLMILWPYYDTRFWIPLLPIFSLAVWSWLEDSAVNRKPVRFCVLCILVCHIFLGFVAQAFSTRISLAGDNVSEYFGEESTRMTYREALRNGFPVDAELVHPGKLLILRVFEPMAKTPSIQNQRN
jgi:hypothetical protein